MATRDSTSAAATVERTYRLSKGLDLPLTGRPTQQVDGSGHRTLGTSVHCDPCTTGEKRLCHGMTNATSGPRDKDASLGEFHQP